MKPPPSLLLLRLLLVLVLLPRADAFAVRPTALVTGANRGLGKATAEMLVEVGYHVILTARNEAEGEACTHALQERGQGAGGGGSAEFFPLDVTSAAQRGRLAAFLLEHPLLSHEKCGAPDLWINNAGVCIRQGEENDDGDGDGDGSSGDTNARRAAYEESLAVNTWGPVRLLTEACLPRMRRRGYGCVINVSSGDGELAYLHSVAAKRLRAMRSLEELERYAAKVANKQAPGAAWPRQGIAHLAWPAYCFSKAALNTATRILHEAEAAHARGVAGTAADPMRGRVQRGERGVRVVAICPGDVATGMCDVDPSKALSPRQAALDIVWVALHPHDCPGGRFYRAREEIEW